MGALGTGCSVLPELHEKDRNRQASLLLVRGTVLVQGSKQSWRDAYTGPRPGTNWPVGPGGIELNRADCFLGAIVLLKGAFESSGKNEATARNGASESAELLKAHAKWTYTKNPAPKQNAGLQRSSLGLDSS